VCFFGRHWLWPKSINTADLLALDKSSSRGKQIILRGRSPTEVIRSSVISQETSMEFIGTKEGPIWIPSPADDLQLSICVFGHMGRAEHCVRRATTDAITRVFYWSALPEDVHCSAGPVCTRSAILAVKRFRAPGVKQFMQRSQTSYFILISSLWEHYGVIS
jgi:hypothetical protein